MFVCVFICVGGSMYHVQFGPMSGGGRDREGSDPVQ